MLIYNSLFSIYNTRGGGAIINGPLTGIGVTRGLQKNLLAVSGKIAPKIIIFKMEFRTFFLKIIYGEAVYLSILEMILSLKN